ncbi:hypothetical protein GS399_06685 [Pedobacter sp. HMF7647]|uniref:Uncharacterized protein n=1 Tax=Hufsiella arboris TaxID=2695275 RepID=A0A7K1Y7T7_9SPHI|nr:hypothetical protein [Hufsiella arboris]MXV50654.1 hypothetical protein [Hufsiella arboris]
MKKIAKTVLLLLFLASGLTLHAQDITDGQTINLDGLEVTFRVVNQESVEIKGAKFDRYKVVASVKNNTQKSYNVRLKNYPDPSSFTAGKLVELNCVNATGAKLTSKKIEVKMNTQQVSVTYPTKDKNDKIINSLMVIIAGYYLDPGQTVENDTIFIVPKDEKPKVTVRPLS